jgi:acetyl esterase/lipase
MVATALIWVAYLFPTSHPDVGRAAGSPGAAPSRFQGGIRVWQDLRYAGTSRAKLDVYRPAQRVGRLPGVLVVHGGAWRDGDKARMGAVSRRIARSGLIAFSVNYSLARGSRPGFPAQPRQLRQAVRWIRRSSDRFELDPRRIGAMGSSAGGHLVSLLGTDGRGSLRTGARVRAVATWSAPLDLGP